MNKNYVIMCVFFIIGMILLIISCIFLYRMHMKKMKCIPFSGGSFNIIFNTNGGNEIDSFHVGIAVSPDSYLDLPIPVYDGYTFDGWYYDSNFNSKVFVSSSKDISPVPIYDKNKCVIGYKNIELFAKWIK